MSQQSITQLKEDNLRAEQVEAFLKRHPKFLLERETLLDTLDLPHPCGPAVSLLLRQIHSLRDKNRRLQHQLNDMVEIARDNDGLNRRVHQLMLALMDARHVEDAVASLEWILHDCFQADFVALRILQNDEGLGIPGLHVTQKSPEMELFGSVLMSRDPQVGRLNEAEATLLFGNRAQDLKSSATIPLSHARLRGMLVIGSCEESRFHPGMGYMFLTQIGEIVAARFANLSDSKG